MAWDYDSYAGETIEEPDVKVIVVDPVTFLMMSPNWPHPYDRWPYRISPIGLLAQGRFWIDGGRKLIPVKNIDPHYANMIIGKLRDNFRVRDDREDETFLYDLPNSPLYKAILNRVEAGIAS